MNAPLACTKTDRRKNIRLLRELGERLKSSGDMAVHGVSRGGAGFSLWDEAHAIRWALSYVERHVNLRTGELTIPLDEPEEAA